MGKSNRIMAIGACLASIAIGFAAAQTPLPVPAASTLVMEDAEAIVRGACLACHSWAADRAGIVSGGLVIPGRPEESPLIRAIESGSMPPSPPRLGPEELAALYAWIRAGAPGSEGPVDATSGATSVEKGTGSFLGFPSKAAYHRAAGWASAGLLLAAGAVGAVRAYDLISAGHEYRDAMGIDEDTMGSVCSDEISSLWSADQALRWAHVGLLVAGESIYLGNAITGMAMRTPGGTGAPTRSDLHRYAFYAHAGLMAAEMVLGFFTTDALSRGDHELVSSLGVAHAAVGFAIPVLIIGSGVVIGR